MTLREGETDQGLSYREAAAVAEARVEGENRIAEMARAHPERFSPWVAPLIAAHREWVEARKEWMQERSPKGFPKVRRYEYACIALASVPTGEGDK